MRKIVVLFCLLMAMPFVNLPNVSAAATKESHDTLGSGEFHITPGLGEVPTEPTSASARVFTGRVINLIAYAYGK